jgi:hypothetical protein
MSDCGIPHSQDVYTQFAGSVSIITCTVWIIPSTFSLSTGVRWPSCIEVLICTVVFERRTRSDVPVMRSGCTEPSSFSGYNTLSWRIWRLYIYNGCGRNACSGLQRLLRRSMCGLRLKTVARTCCMYASVYVAWWLTLYATLLSSTGDDKPVSCYIILYYTASCLTCICDLLEMSAASEMSAWDNQQH